MAEENQNQENTGGILSQVIEKISGASNILVALSKNPGVDDIAAAVGLTLALEKMGKHATAIFSGKVPNVLEFLEPEKTFENDTSSLQDFIIELNKDKADHLNVKLEGEFVRVYITPYRVRLSDKDLEFKYGDYNVDLVISINVSESAQLDAALSEHGRIMHNATAIDLSTSIPGHFAELDWTNPAASSVSEMVAEIVTESKGSTIDRPIATALLAGIVSATERFSNEKATPRTMVIASELMKAGADQKLIVSSMLEAKKAEREAKENPVVDSSENSDSSDAAEDRDPNHLRIRHEEKKEVEIENGSADVEPVAENNVAAAENVATPNAGPTPFAEATANDDARELERIIEEDPKEEGIPTGPLMDELRRVGEVMVEPEAAPEGVNYGEIMEKELAEPLPGVEEYQAPLSGSSADGAVGAANIEEDDNDGRSFIGGTFAQQNGDNRGDDQPAIGGSDFAGVSGAGLEGPQQGANPDEYVFNRPEMTISPLAMSGADADDRANGIISSAGLPSVAPIEEIVSAANSMPMPGTEPDFGIPPPPMPMPEGDTTGFMNGQILPPPPPPPVPFDGGDNPDAFHLPGM
jgi:hypothetical protein